MTSTEIAVRETAAIAERDIVDGWIAIASDVIKVANHICETDFVPKEYRGNPPAVAAAILTGRELGIGPMMSLRHVQIVRGVPTLSAEYKRARVLAAGHDFEVVELNTQRCKLRGRRAGTSKWLETGFTMDDARTAKIVKSDGAWMTRPRRMLFARAGSELCDFLFADVTNGLPTAELVAEGSDGDEFAGYDESPAQPSPAAPAQPAQRTARRGRSAPPIVPPADAASPVAAASPAPPPQAGTAGGTPLPPLPGEEENSGPGVQDETPASGPAPGPEAAAKAVGDMFERLATHVDHELKQEGRCVYCVTCNERLYQGRMWTAKDRNEIRESMRQKAATPEPDDTDYDTPGTATRGKGGQLTAIWTVLSTVFGFSNEEKPQARGVCEHIIGRPLVGGTTGNLSFNEARTVLDTLANWQKLAEGDETPPRQVLVALMAAGSSDE